jgi:hypothetical protein
MKKYLSQAAMVAVFFLIVSTSLAENYTATTDTVGFVTLNITTGTGSVRKSTLISAPLLDTASINGSVTGNITGVTATTMTCSTANWTAGALSQAAAPYLIQITSGNATGHMFLISTTTPNTSTTVTVNSDDQKTTPSLTALGIAAGAAFKIIPCDTLSSFFGTPASTGFQGGTSAASADNVVMVVNGISSTYYYNTSLNRWAKNAIGNPDSSNVPIRPYAGMEYRRLSTAPLAFTVTGSVPSISRKTYIKNSGVTLLARYWPQDTTLSASGLKTNLASIWTTGTATTGDTVTITSNGTSNTYYHNGTNWVHSLSNANSDAVVISSGSSLMINQRGAAASSTILTETSPY